jgi:hypothetical protein
MQRLSASFASAAKQPDQKEHASETADLKEQQTSQRCECCREDGIQDEEDHYSVGAQDQARDEAKDFEGQRRSPGLSVRLCSHPVGRNITCLPSLYPNLPEELPDSGQPLA